MEVQSGTALVACDDKCRKLTEAKKAKEAEEAAKREEEEREKNAKIAADFERRMKGPKRNRRNRSKSETEKSAGWKEKLPSLKGCLIASAIIAAAAAVVAATIVGLKIDD